MSDTYSVQRTTQIDAPASEVYGRIADFHRWPGWSPYEELDPDMERSYTGAESGAGAGYEWSGNMKAGAGRMEIVEAMPHERIVIDLKFSKPFRSEATATFTLVGSGDTTSVTWSMTGPVTTATRVMGVFRSMDKMMGPVFEKGLAQLKAEAEDPAST